MEKVARPDSSVRASGHSERPALASLYAVAGRSICVECGDAETADLFRRYFEGWHVAPLGGDEAVGVRSDTTISVSATRVPPRAPDDFESFEIASGGVCRTDGRTYLFEAGDSAVMVRGDSPSRVEVWIGATPRARQRAALARLIFNASMTAMRRCGLFELHGAGLVAPGGAGVLFVGPSGSGKSTLATQLAHAGWRYLSDDSLLLCARGVGVEARALRRAFAVTDATVEAGPLGGFENFLTEAPPFDPQKRRFEPESVFPGGFVESCEPRAIFFPAVTNEGESRTRALTQAETMARLIRMCPWACYDRPAAKAHLDVLARLARQAAGFELFAGRDLLDAERAACFLLSRAGVAQ
jgi:hypothetical protein